MAEIFYAVNDNGEIIQYGPFNLGTHWFRNSQIHLNDCCIFAHGLMFDSDWSPGTPHIILLKDHRTGEISNIYQTYNWSDDDTQELAAVFEALSLTGGQGFRHLFDVE